MVSSLRKIDGATRVAVRMLFRWVTRIRQESRSGPESFSWRPSTLSWYLDSPRSPGLTSAELPCEGSPSSRPCCSPLEMSTTLWYSRPWWRTPGEWGIYAITIQPKYAALFKLLHTTLDNISQANGYRQHVRNNLDVITELAGTGAIYEVLAGIEERSSETCS